MPKQALPGVRRDVIYMNPNDLVIVGLDTKDGPEHPLYDERVTLPLDESLVLNIMYHGVLESISVRKDGDVPQVIAGRRRVRHAREANKRLRAQGKEPVLVPALNKRGTDKDMLGIMVSENEHRKDDTPLVKARKVQKLLNQGATEEECAVIFGVTTKAIENWVKLLDCDDKIVKAVEAGTVSASAAAKLSKLPRAEQREKLEEMLVNGKATTKHATALVKQKEEKTRARDRGEGDTEVDVRIAPGKRLLRRVLSAVEEGAELDEQVIKALRYVVGDLDARAVKGLSKILGALDKADEEKVQARLESKRQKKSPPRAGAANGGN